jgi:hypothetical protein
MLGRREVWGPGETGRSEYGVDGTRGYAPLRFSRCICLNLRILIPDPTCGRSLCFRLMQVYPALRGPRPSIMPSGSPPASHVFGSSPTSETDSTISEEDPMRLTSLTSNLTSGATATILGDLGHKVAIPIPQRLAPIRPSLQLFLPLAPGTGSPQPIQSLFAAHHVLDLDCDQGDGSFLCSLLLLDLRLATALSIISQIRKESLTTAKIPAAMMMVMPITDGIVGQTP